MFERDTAAEAIRAFRDTVDDYLARCAENGIEPEPPTAPVASALASA